MSLTSLTGIGLLFANCCGTYLRRKTSCESSGYIFAMGRSSKYGNLKLGKLHE